MYYNPDGIMVEKNPQPFRDEALRQQDRHRFIKPGEHISKLVGEEMAAEILALPESYTGRVVKAFEVPEGERMKVGGGALRGFYNREIGQKLNKYLRQVWGKNVYRVGESAVGFGISAEEPRLDEGGCPGASADVGEVSLLPGPG